MIPTTPVRQPGPPGRGGPRSALATLVELHQRRAGDRHQAVQPTGFTPLDDALSGGVRPGELVLVGGKPGVGKTTACLQWARTMARRGVVSVYACFDHDPATLVARLLACELREAALADQRLDGLSFEELQGRLGDVAAGALTLREALDSDPLLGRAQQRIAAYGDRLVLYPASTTRTDVAALSDEVSRFAGESYVLFVDYVQKVPAAAMSSAHVSENDRIGRVVAALKEVALEQRAAVVAVSAAGEQGLTARRLHLHHLRGAARLAYEADAVVLLNEKLDVVSPSHVAYSTLRLDQLGRRVVFSVEKNRNGPSGVDVEFAKEFDSSRFDPQGAWVTEPLWHELGAES
jgi:replicative DNA helicase